jgi:hypothetical protein
MKNGARNPDTFSMVSSKNFLNVLKTVLTANAWKILFKQVHE